MFSGLFAYNTVDERRSRFSCMVLKLKTGVAVELLVEVGLLQNVAQTECVSEFSKFLMIQPLPKIQNAR